MFLFLKGEGNHYVPVPEGGGKPLCSSPFKGEGNRYVPPPSRGRSGGGWVSVGVPLVSSAPFMGKDQPIEGGK